MHFEDGVLARLGDPQARTTLLAGAGVSLARAAFGLTPAPGTVVSVTVTSVTYAVSLEPEMRVDVEGRIDLQQGRLVGQAILRPRGVAPIADAVVEGTLGLMINPSLARIKEVRRSDITLPSLAEIDAAMAAAGDGEAGETAARVLVGRRLIAGTAALDDASVDRLIEPWLKLQGLVPARRLVDGLPDSSGVLGMSLVYEPLSEEVVPAGGLLRNVPFRAGLLVRNVAADKPWLMGVLREARQLKRGMQEQPLVMSAVDGLDLRDAAPVLVCVPHGLFADTQWPGADGAAPVDQQDKQRESAAINWLASEGVALLPVKLN
jgi:hypothetical protein